MWVRLKRAEPLLKNLSIEQRKHLAEKFWMMYKTQIKADDKIVLNDIEQNREILENDLSEYLKKDLYMCKDARKFIEDTSEFSREVLEIEELNLKISRKYNWKYIYKTIVQPIDKNMPIKRINAVFYREDKNWKKVREEHIREADLLNNLWENTWMKSILEFMNERKEELINNMIIAKTKEEKLNAFLWLLSFHLNHDCNHVSRAYDLMLVNFFDWKRPEYLMSLSTFMKWKNDDDLLKANDPDNKDILNITLRLEQLINKNVDFYKTLALESINNKIVEEYMTSTTWWSVEESRKYLDRFWSYYMQWKNTININKWSIENDIKAIESIIDEVL